MSKTDDQILRGFIEGVHDGEWADGDRPDALAALDRIISRTLPELPEGWRLVSVGENLSSDARDGYQGMVVLTNPEQHVFPEGYGPTPRAAVLQAIERIGERG